MRRASQASKTAATAAQRAPASPAAAQRRAASPAAAQRRAASPAAAQRRAASPAAARAPTTKPAPYRQLLATIEASIRNQPPTELGTTPDQRAWLEENARADPEIVVLPCGVQYKIVSSAPPHAKSPKLDTPCTVHYWGSTTDGVEFDSSYERGAPAKLVPSQMIGGWTVAMQLMAEGDTWLLAVPSELAYGDAGRADERRGQYIPPGAVLIFELEMLAVHGPGKPKPRRPAAPPPGRFVPATAFGGARFGYVFTTGEWGTGYYREGGGAAGGEGCDDGDGDGVGEGADGRAAQAEPPPSGEAAASAAPVAAPSAAPVPADEAGGASELFEREPSQPPRRASAATGRRAGATPGATPPRAAAAAAAAAAGRKENERPGVSPKAAPKEAAAAVPKLACPLHARLLQRPALRVLRENLGQAETPVEAVQALLSRLRPATVRAVSDDLGLAAAPGADKAELTHRLTQLLSDREP